MSAVDCYFMCQVCGRARCGGLNLSPWVLGWGQVEREHGIFWQGCVLPATGASFKGSGGGVGMGAPSLSWGCSQQWSTLPACWRSSA